MADSSEIRSQVITSYVQPARSRGEHTVTIRVGDVVHELSPAPAIPAVSAVLGSDLFEREARVRRLAVDGPIPGATTLFVFRLRE